MLQREVEADVLPYCAQHDIAFVPWGPLAYGLLGGKYSRDFVLPENDWRHRSGVFDTDAYPRNLDIVDALRPIAAEGSMPLAHLASGWLMSRPGVCSVIAGAKRHEQVEENASAAGATLDQRTLAAVDRILD